MYLTGMVADEACAEFEPNAGLVAVITSVSVQLVLEVGARMVKGSVT